MRDLLEIRKDIDAVDHQIVDLYLRRLELAGQVAQSKIETGKHVYDAVREAEKLDALGRLAPDSFSEKGIRELFTQVMSGSRKKQYAILAEHGRVANVGYSKVDAFDFQNAGIIYQGVEGAYAEVALETFFGKNHDIRSVKSWRDAFLELKEGRADYAVLPIDNSTTGIVSGVYDLLQEYNNYIVAETYVPVEHALLGLKGADINKVTTVYSHPQGLMQCNEYLEEHEDWQRIAKENTAGSAMKVMKENDKSHAAIASTMAAKIYGLKVLEENINRNNENTTRFVIVSRKRVFREDANKVLVSFETAHKTGSLYNILSHFIFNGINMTSIESRPIREKNWEYRFFVEAEGNILDEGMQNALIGIKNEASYLKVIGSY